MNVKDESARTAGPAGQCPEILSRREASRRLLSVAAVLHLDTLHPVWNHLRLQPTLQDAESPGGTNKKPILLTVDQLSDFAAIAEGIVPGSTKALVASFVDLLLSVDLPEVQQGFIRSLAVIQAEATRQFGSTFAGLTLSQRDEVLAAASTAHEDTPQRAAFTDLKTWIVGAYYSSEPGMTELGWTPSRFFDVLPACSLADGAE